MPSSATAQADLGALIDLTKTSQTILSQFLATLTPQSSTLTSTPARSETQDTSVDPLGLFKDAATLLKAHTTKLSLLLINKPFTATAITRVLRDITGTVLPAMMGGVQICEARAEAHLTSRVVEKEARARVRRVMSAVAEELVEVKGMAEREIDEGNGGGKAKDGREGRDTLASTGLVWEACDAMIELQSMGVVGLVVKKAEEWRATLLDAVEELKEWGEEADEDEEDEEEDVGSDDEKDSMDDLFGGSDRMPKGNEELRMQLEASLKKIKTITMLYQAVAKRRLKTFPAKSAPKETDTLDQLLETLKAIPEMVDEMASSFYDLNGEDAKKILSECSAKASLASVLVKQNWSGQDDEFTAWSAKFQEAIST
ncbi:hypothetical protein K490DRAFT_66542 [Saccharata proteae CBS 121410]|uniref:Cyclin-D1-binding protein 1-like N-terminal domain-containing protein n=1 Tax=Saccharata proteae CBS 121410 TaxID=1314787 RepID=A0A9P4LUQ7_9PEZI|nr:hypothetical protein K490DRAFT_66542 [Saccharata proteae CBS 121410]